MKNYWAKVIILVFGVFGATVCSIAFSKNTQAYDNLYTVTYPYYAFVEDPDSPWSSVWDALDATGTVEYSDELFDEESSGIHPKLRTVSYALALAGFENQDDGYPAISSNYKLYTMLNELGFSNFQSWDIASEDDGYSMGTTIGYKTLSSGQNLIVVAPRNYNYMTEWLSNFNVGVSGDHAGFSYSANLMSTRLSQYISTHNLNNNKIWIVGYSRGGAVVDLVAREINQNLATYSTSTEDLYAYTFGAPKASSINTQYPNIHDVKDGNDLLLGYLFPDQWGFYNTGTYDEIHPADLQIPAAAIDTTDLDDASKVISILINNEGVTKDLGSVNGKEFIDQWLQFMTTHGLTREYFDSEVKPPLSEIMKAYQLRTIDKQSEFTGFITDTQHGMLGMVAQKAFVDLIELGFFTDPETALANFLPYQDILKIIRGSANADDINELATYLKNYIGEYDEYEANLGAVPPITEGEFTILNNNIPELLKALGPLLVEDAKYTKDTYDENCSLYFTYTLVSNFNNLVYGHIPESIMPILKELDKENHIIVPDTGTSTNDGTSKATEVIIVFPTLGTIMTVMIFAFRQYRSRTLER